MYKKEIEALLKDLFFEDWMNSDDWQEFETAFFKEMGVTYKELSMQIEDGIKNGYNIEYQISLIKNHYSLYKS